MFVVAFSYPVALDLGWNNLPEKRQGTRDVTRDVEVGTTILKDRSILGIYRLSPTDKYD